MAHKHKFRGRNATHDSHARNAGEFEVNPISRRFTCCAHSHVEVRAFLLKVTMTVSEAGRGGGKGGGDSTPGRVGKGPEKRVQKERAQEGKVPEGEGSGKTASGLE